MGLIFDHAFVFVDSGGPEADALATAGLCEGPSNTHRGQGTRNRRFFFRNGMLEFLWVYSRAAGSGAVSRTRLLERSRYKLTGACPFGIALSRTEEEREGLPFPTWSYAPSYLLAGVAIRVAEVSESLKKPFVFVMSGIESEPTNSSAVSVRKVELQYPGWDRSDFGNEFGADGVVSLSHGQEPLMLMSLKAEPGGKCVDLRPQTPLVVEW